MVVSKRRTFPLEPSFSNASIPQRCLVCIYTADVFSAHEIYIFLLLHNRFFIPIARFPSKDSQTSLKNWVSQDESMLLATQSKLIKDSY